MRTIWASLVLICVSGSLSAESNVASSQEQQRVARMVLGRVYVKDGPLANTVSRRSAVQKQLMEMIYSASPDLNEIEKLRLQEHELSLEVFRLSFQADQAAIAGLTDAEHLAYLQATHPRPPLLRIPSK